MSGVFTPVGRASWPRGQIFWYYTEAAPTAYSMTVSLDVTKTRLALRAAGRKFFPAYLWLVTRAIGHQPALRTAEREGAVGYWIPWCRPIPGSVRLTAPRHCCGRNTMRHSGTFTRPIWRTLPNILRAEAC